MARVTPEAKTRWYLLRGNKTKIAKRLDVTPKTVYNRIDRPSEIRLWELAILAKMNELTDEQIANIVRMWQ